MAQLEIPEVLTAAWLREKYRARELTPESVLAEVVKRAEADVSMNIWITPPSMETLRPYLERLAELDPEFYPLWGLPLRG